MATRDKGGQRLQQISHLYHKAKLSPLSNSKSQIAVCTENYSQIPVYTDEVTPKTKATLSLITLKILGSYKV
jgi:hypothetical protein